MCVCGGGGGGGSTKKCCLSKVHLQGIPMTFSHNQKTMNSPMGLTIMLTLTLHTLRA